MAVNKSNIRLYPFASDAPRVSQRLFQCQMAMRKAYMSLNCASQKSSSWQDVIWSLVCHSAVWDDAVLSQILKQIQCKCLTPRYILGHCFIDVRLEKGTTNRTLANGEKVRENVLPLHPITLALINKLPEQRRLPTNVLKEALRDLPIEHAYAPRTLQQFCHAGTGVAEVLSHDSLAEHVIQAWIGKLPTSSLPMCQFECLQSQTQTLEHTQTVVSSLFQREVEPHLSVNINQSIFPMLQLVFYNIRKENKPKPKALIITLKMVLSHCQSDHERILTCWLINQMEAEKNGVSTVLRYHGAISRRWLATFENELILELSTEQIDEAYETILDTAGSVKNQGYVKGRLRDLHEYAFHCFGVAATTIDWGGKQANHVRVAVVSEQLFDWLLQQVDKQMGWSEHEKMTAKVALIVLYRTGLRVGELAKLLVGEVEFSDQLWLYVFPNQFGNNKSLNARRKIPLRALITDREWRLCQPYFAWAQLNQEGKKGLLFHAEHDVRGKMDTQSLSIWVSQMLTLQTGDTAYCLHSLRHSFVSRLHLIFNDIEHLPGMVELQQQEFERLYSTLLSSDPNRRMLDLAALAGHESPKVTYRSYVHLTMILIARFISKMDIRFTVKQMRNLGLSQSQAYQYLGNENTIGYQDAVEKIANIYGLDTAPKTMPPLPTKINTPTLANLQARDANVVCYVLNDILSGIDLPTVANRYLVHVDTVLRWVARHNAFFSFHAEAKTRQPFTLPVAQKETAQLFKMVRKITKLPAEEKVKFDHITPYLLKHFPKSRTGLYFSSPRQLSQCLSAFAHLTKRSDWKVEVVNHDTKRVKKRWEKALHGIEVHRETHNERQAKGTVFLYYAPNEKDGKDDIATKSTRTLWSAVYLCYVMAND